MLVSASFEAHINLQHHIITYCTILFHRRTRASYVYNGCLAWYNVVLTHGSTQA